MRLSIPRQATKRNAPRFITAAELRRETPAQPAWLWDGYVARGALTLIAGQPKVGKSSLLFGLLGALEQATPFLGRTTRATGAVVLSEERGDGLREKADRFGLERVHLVPRHERGGLSWPELVDAAVVQAEAEELGLLVVDTFAELAGLQGDEENDSGRVLEALRPLQVAADRGLAVLILAHHRKSGGRHGAAVRGSNALTGAADVVLDVTRGKGPRVRLLRSESRFAATPPLLVLELAGDEYRAIGEREMPESRERVLAALEDLGEGTNDELAEESGLPTPTVKRTTQTMREAAEIVVARGSGKRGDPFVWRFPAQPETSEAT